MGGVRCARDLQVAGYDLVGGLYELSESFGYDASKISVAIFEFEPSDEDSEIENFQNFD